MTEYVIVGSDSFSRALAKELGTQIIEVNYKKFPDNEIKPTINVDSVKKAIDKKALIVSRTDRSIPDSNKKIWEIGFITDSLIRNGMGSVDILAPYMYYARQDRPALPGEPASLAVVAKTLEDWGYSNIFTVNSHLYGKETTLQDFFSEIKIHDISVSRLFSEYLAGKDLRNPIVLGPGEGPEKMAIELSANLDCDYECLEKTRDLTNQKVSMEPPQADLQGRDLVIYDDISSSGGTIAEIYNLANERNPSRIFLALVHILTHDGIERLQNLWTYEIITTDSLMSDGPKQYTELPLVPLISDYIKAL